MKFSAALILATLSALLLASCATPPDAFELMIEKAGAQLFTSEQQAPSQSQNSTLEVLP